MRHSLNQKFIFNSVITVILMGLISMWIIMHLLEVSTLREVRSRIEVNLSVAEEIFTGHMNELATVIRLAADGTPIKESLNSKDSKAALQFMQVIRTREGLDILTLIDQAGVVLLRTANPEVIGDNQSEDEIISRVLHSSRPVTATQIIPESELVKEGAPIVAKASFTIEDPTSGMKSKTKIASGLLIKAAAPVFDESAKLIGVLYGGILLNRNDALVDKIAKIIFRGEIYKGRLLGQVGVFQGDLRVATDLVNSDGTRAIGTHVYEDVKVQVLNEGKTYLARAKLRKDWYLTGYQPIRNIDQKIIGILGVGIQEQKYRDLKNQTLLTFFGIIFAGVIGAFTVAFFLSRSITKPIRKLVRVSRELAAGNLDVQVGFPGGDEIAELGNGFNTMIQAIKDRDERLRKQAQEEVQQAERMAMIGRLSAGIAHEINNPLGSILLFTRLVMQKAPAEGTVRENLERIERETKRCQTIVQGLLDFSRKREPKIELVRIDELLDKTLRLFESHPTFHNIELIKDYQSNLPAIPVDSSQMMQVFVNLIMNSIDAMQGSGILTIDARSFELEKVMKITISDTGCGIPPEHLKKMFEPFFTTKAVGQGTGLGLSISYGIIRNHGGDIKVFSNVGEGATFIISLPLTREKS